MSSVGVFPKKSKLTVPAGTGTEVFSGNSPITSFADLDLSGTVGKRSALVFLKLIQTSGTTSRQFYFRKNGDTDTPTTNVASSSGCASVIVAALAESVFVLVATDTNGVIEWLSDAVRACTIDVVAFIA